MVCSFRLSQTQDVSYAVAGVGVLLFSETTAGFLILGIPSIPKVLGSIGMLKKFMSYIKSWMGSSMSKTRTNSRKGLPSWYKPMSRKKPRRVEDVSEWENDGGLVEMTNLGSTNSGSVQKKSVGGGDAQAAEHEFIQASLPAQSLHC